MSIYLLSTSSPSSACSGYSLITMMHTFLDSDVGSGTSGYVKFFFVKMGAGCLSEPSYRCDSTYDILEKPQPTLGTEANGTFFC